jgi:hypothetical protein
MPLCPQAALNFSGSFRSLIFSEHSDAPDALKFYKAWRFGDGFGKFL